MTQTKSVSIIGIGMGPHTVTGEALARIQEAEVLLGAPRMLAGFSLPGKDSLPVYAPNEVAAAIRTSDRQRFCVLVSGDVGFFSAAAGLLPALDFCTVELLPGISSLAFFAARLQLPWEDMALLSCHGRSSHVADTVRRSRRTFLLTGGNVPAIAHALTDAGFGELTVFVGENLGSPAEQIFSCTAQELQKKQTASLTVLLVENPAPSSGVEYGIDDARFCRGKVPMTKAEVRAVILSKLAVSPRDTVIDVGAGTGSVTVEMGLAAWQGQVFAVEQNPEALPLIRENCRRFHLGNVTLCPGKAPESMADLPPADAVFIGGSSGCLADIVQLCVKKNPHVRLVTSAIAIETLAAAKAALEAAGISPRICQVSVARSEAAGKLHLLKGENPIFIIYGGGRYAS